MISATVENKVLIQTTYDDTMHCYGMKAMVRVLSLAMSANVNAEDRDMLVVYCDLLESMLPEEGQLVLEAPPKSPTLNPSPKGRDFKDLEGNRVSG